MKIELTALELASPALVECAIWTLGTVMPKIAFCTMERQWQSGRKSMIRVLLTFLMALFI
jgi:hypothetical protein